MRVCVTGGSGFLGRALLRRFCDGHAERVVTVTRDEQKRVALDREFGDHPGFRVYAGDVRDAERLVDLFSGCDSVVHCAARKIVNAHPDEADEMIRTNLVGTQNVAHAARTAGVQKVLFISSDKAVHPETQTYGLSKALAERFIVAYNARAHAGGLRLSVLRYGNVVGSTGSVVVHWRAQHASGEPLKLSDERMTRFWLSVSQAVDFVLCSLTTMRGGEVIVPDVPAAPITRLAEAVIGLAPKFNMTGIRHGGEKLHEQLLTDDEVRRARRLRGMFIVPPDVPHQWHWDGSRWLGEPVPADMVYRSDVWRQASIDELRAMIGMETPIEVRA